ncbi:MAG: M48 family metallopeptidase [Burkholderiaceae bacterium]
MKRLIHCLSAAVLVLAATVAQAQVEVQRPRFLVLPEAMANQTSAQQYAQMLAEARAKGALNRDSAQTARVRAIAERLIPQGRRFNPAIANWRWEANVFHAPTVNAFAMPGGKIAVYSGLIDQLGLSDDELAAVIGHEIAHAVLEHGRARMQSQLAQNVGVAALSMYFGLGDLGTAALAQAAEVALALPYSRGQEVDADLAGLEMAARAGYDPRAAVSVWQKMSKLGGGQPPQWLSTHPDHQKRIKEIEAALPQVMPLYRAAR